MSTPKTPRIPPHPRDRHEPEIPLYLFVALTVGGPIVAFALVWEVFQWLAR